LALAESPTQFLSTVQIGITLVGILAGAFGEAMFAAPLAERLATVPALEPIANQLALGFVVLAITFLSLLIGELVPKRLALANPEKIAAVLAAPMRVLARIAAPFVFVLSRITDAIVSMLRVSTRAEAVTEEEIKGMIEEGARSGVFLEAESEMVGRVFQLGDLAVSALMTPRQKVTVLDVDDAPAVWRQKLLEHPHSRFPVTRGGPENVIGIIKTKDLMVQYLSGKSLDLSALHPALFVPERMPALDLLELFKTEGAHIALVTDEYGGLQGIVTVSDIAEAIVGQVPLAGDAGGVGIVRRADGSWLVDGALALHEFREGVGMEYLPPDAERKYQTVGGLVMTMLGRIPAVGDAVNWDEWRFEVMDMDGRRVDKVLVVRKIPSENAA
jgi:putative hemolysin